MRTPKKCLAPKRRVLNSLTLLFVSGASFGTLQCPAQDDSPRRLSVHDPAVIKQDETFYLFSTGRGIHLQTSNDLIHWKRAGSIFEQNPEWAQQAIPRARSLWAPDISFFSDRYHLYYSVSTFGSNVSHIGLATNVTLDPEAEDYRWEDQGEVIGSRRGDDYNAIDPNVVIDEQGVPWLSFGSFWSGIKLIQLDPVTGKPATNAPLMAIASRNGEPIEAPFIIRQGEWYYLFVSFDYCCRGAESTYKIMVGRAPEVTGPYVDRQGVPMMQGGGTLVLESEGLVYGPGHNAILSDSGKQYLVHHFYDGENRGRPALQVRPLEWDADGWPVVQAPLEKAVLQR